MPYLDIRIASPLLEESTSRKLALAGTRLAQSLLGKRPEVTAVSVHAFPMWAWMTGRNVQSEIRAPAAYAELTITAGTNSQEQKAAFVSAMSDALKEELPGLSAASYVVIREVDAENWGYDGVTQHARRRQAEIEAGAEPAVRRLPSGALDMAYYEARARKLRSEALAYGAGELQRWLGQGLRLARLSACSWYNLGFKAIDQLIKSFQCRIQKGMIGAARINHIGGEREARCIGRCE